MSGRFPLTPATVCFVVSNTVVTLTGADRQTDRQLTQCETTGCETSRESGLLHVSLGATE